MDQSRTKNTNRMLWAGTVAVAVLALLFVILHHDRAAEHAAADPEVAVSRTSVLDEPRTAQIADDRSDASSHLSPSGGAEQLAPPPVWPRVISGTLNLADRDGAPIAVIRGGIKIDETTAEGKSQLLRARVDGQNWSLKVERQAQLTPLAVEVNTQGSPEQSVRAAVSSVSFSSSVERGPEIAAVLEPGPLLYVFDGATGRPVPECELILSTPKEPLTSQESQNPPSEYASLAQRLVLLPHAFAPFLGTRVGWVRTLDSAWQRFAVSRSDVTVRLDPGANLHVAVTSLGVDGNPMFVRVHSTDPDLAEPILLVERRVTEPGTLHFEGLPAGPAVVRLDRLAPVGPGTTVASRDTVLVVGARNVVVLDSAESHAQLGRISLVLHRSPDSDALHVEGLSLVIEERGHAVRATSHAIRPADIEITADRAVCRGPDLVPGDYVVSVAPLGFSSHVNIRAKEESTLEFQLAPQCWVSVSVTSESGALRSGAELLVRPSPARAAIAWRGIRASATDKRYHFGTQPGRYQFVYPGVIGAEEITEVEIKEARQSIEIRMNRSTPIDCLITLADGSSPVAFPESYWRAVQVESLDSDGGRVLATRSMVDQVGGYSALDTARMTYVFNKAGLYRFTLPKWFGHGDGTVADLKFEHSGEEQTIQLRSR